MGLSASQGRMLLLTARKNDLEFRAQQISQKRLVLSQQLEDIAMDYENATSNRQMKIALYLGGTNDDGKNVSRTSNLTYAALVSGTLSLASSDLTGIRACDRTSNQEYTSNSYYRLTSVDGAIVVSDVNEIPESMNTYVQDTLRPDKDGIYKHTSYDNDGAATKTNYMVAKAGSELLKYLQGDNAVGEAKVDTKSGLIYLKDAEGKMKYFNLEGKEGSLKDGQVQFTKSEEQADGTTHEVVASKVKPKTEAEMESLTAVSLRASRNSIPDNTTQQVTGKLKEGADGKYSIVDENGAVISRYIVDESLKYGSTDQYGTAGDGPNYLQDCLRNGKYLIQQYNTNVNNGEVSGRWNSISWDATSNISDQYYTEDDDKAKAKYDRLQTQIQNQDKKLELELDNIETQRSAVTTEEESVKKVIDDNVEGSFKCFA